MAAATTATTATTMEVATPSDYFATVDDDDGGDNGDDDPFGLHPMCCQACRHSIADLFATVDECFQAMEVMKLRMEDLECVVKDDYKFLNRNVRKLFGMVGNMRGKWCNSCRKYH
jgi:hypothetical protein